MSDRDKLREIIVDRFRVGDTHLSPDGLDIIQELCEDAFRLGKLEALKEESKQLGLPALIFSELDLENGRC